MKYYKMFFSLMPKDVDNKVKIYSSNQRQNNKKIEEMILERLKEKGAKITGNAISDSSKIQFLEV